MIFDLPSGAKFSVTPLPFEQAWELSQTAIRVLGEMQIDLKGANVEDFLKADVMVALKGPMCTLLGHQALMPSVRKAWERCNYNGVKIDSSTFNAAEARGDFIFCAYYALKENIVPFFASLSSFFATQSTEAKTK